MRSCSRIQLKGFVAGTELANLGLAVAAQVLGEHGRPAPPSGGKNLALWSVLYALVDGDIVSKGDEVLLFEADSPAK
jgi:hypothetical protein